MNTIYNTEFDAVTVKNNLNRIGSQIFRLLPAREEGLEWDKPLETILIELSGLYCLLQPNSDLLALICKLKGLQEETKEEEDFLLYRRTILETCSLMNKIVANIE